MNGNIFNYSLASEQYSWECNCGSFGCSTCSASAIPPMPPGIVFCPLKEEREPLFAQSYINAYNTAFNQETSSFNENYQEALYNYFTFTYSDVNNDFVPGIFGYNEQYNDQSNPSNSITIDYLQDNASIYSGTPYLFVSAGSGGGSGFMYFDWIIVTYGVPYVINAS